MTAIKSLACLLSDSSRAALIISEENRRYFTDFPSSDGFLVVTSEDSVFFTDSRYIEAAQAKITACRVTEQTEIYTQLNEYFSEHGIKSVLIESDRISLSQYNTLCEKLPDLEVLPTKELVDSIKSLRCIKTRAQVECIKTAQRIAEMAFEHILTYIKPGVSERELSLELDYFMLKNKAEALSFETIAVSGKNTSLPHGVPSDKKIEVGDFVTIDFGAVYNGYHSDMTRTVAVGRVSPRQEQIYNTVLQAQLCGIEAVKSGVPCVNIDKVTREVIDKAGFAQYFRHSTGHGVGIEIHEYPNFSPKSTEILQVGNVMTVEPGIYIPDEFGVRIEDMVFVTENGCENLTNSPKELIIL